MPAVWPLWLTPVLIFGGALVSIAWAPDAVEDFYLGALLPYLITFWIGQGFSFAWDVARASVAGVPAPVAAATGLLASFVIMGMLGGVRIILEDPWIFGVAVVPGLRLASAAVARTRVRRHRL